VHLLIPPGKGDSVALLMKNLVQRYVQYINRTYERSCTLWEGRFRSCLMQSDEYVLRYIELNPVRADMVKHPRQYKWSNYCENAEDRKNKILTPHEQYLKIARNDADRRKGYRELFNAHVNQKVDDQMRESTNGNFALGNSRFQEEIEQILGRRVAKGEWVGRRGLHMRNECGLSSIFCYCYVS